MQPLQLAEERPISEGTITVNCPLGAKAGKVIAKLTEIASIFLKEDGETRALAKVPNALIVKLITPCEL